MIKDMKTVIMPIREELLQRLNQVSNNSHLREHLYPLITQAAGRELVGPGVVMMLIQSTADCSVGLPRVVQATTEMFIPAFIKALVDDKEVQNDALDCYAEL